VKSRHVAWVAAATLALSASRVAPSVAQEPATRSVTDRVYSAEQADRGRTLFHDVCIICHPDPLWRSSWEGRNLGEIYGRILKLMPDDAPGSLSPAEAASALAYILQSNGFPEGSVALPTDTSILDRIRIEAPPK
jgi:mono/diheme cytochrome c family protein